MKLNRGQRVVLMGLVAVLFITFILTVPYAKRIDEGSDNIEGIVNIEKVQDNEL